MVQKDRKESFNDYILKSSPEEEEKAREEYRRRRDKIKQSGYASRSKDSDFFDKIVADECRAMEKDAGKVTEKGFDGKSKRSSLEEKKPVNVKIEERKKQNNREEDISVSEWFLTLCWSQIPVIGFLYMVITAFRKNVDLSRKNYAKAYVLFRLLILFLAFCILFGLFRFGVDFLDGMLSFLK